MTYQQWHEVFARKVRDYDWYTCRRAIMDCHETLALHRDLPTDDPYYIKLWAEIDALRERSAALTRGLVQAARERQAAREAR
jgi:hypothetical protein